MGVCMIILAEGSTGTPSMQNGKFHISKKCCTTTPSLFVYISTDGG